MKYSCVHSVQLQNDILTARIRITKRSNGSQMQWADNGPPSTNLSLDIWHGNLVVNNTSIHENMKAQKKLAQIVEESSLRIDETTKRRQCSSLLCEIGGEWDEACA